MSIDKIMAAVTAFGQDSRICALLLRVDQRDDLEGLRHHSFPVCLITACVHFSDCELEKLSEMAERTEAVVHDEAYMAIRAMSSVVESARKAQFMARRTFNPFFVRERHWMILRGQFNMILNLRGSSECGRI